MVIDISSVAIPVRRYCGLMALFSFIHTNNYFGWNRKPQSVEELAFDLVWVSFFMGWLALAFATSWDSKIERAARWLGARIARLFR